MRLYLTASGRYVGTQAEARTAGKGWTPEEVPTDKAGLITYLNTLKDRALNRVPRTFAVVSAAVVKCQSERSPLTQARVDEMFEPRSTKPTLDHEAVCKAVSEYSGVQLGYVALEVAARFTALGKDSMK